MNIYITLEIKKRELQSKLLLSLEAANRGHEVYLGRMMENLKKGDTFFAANKFLDIFYIHH